MTVAFSTRIMAAPDVIFQTVGEESVLLNLKTTLYLGLNPVGTRMWLVLTTAKSIQAALQTLQAEYDAPADQLQKDLEDFLAKLTEYDLIASNPDIAAGSKIPEKT